MQDIINTLLPHMREAHFYALVVTLVTYVLRGLLLAVGSDARNNKLLLLLAIIGFVGLAVSGAVMAMSSFGIMSNMALSKTVGLVGFLVFGLVAMKPGLNRLAAIVVWLIGLAFFIYAMMVIRNLAPMLTVL